MSSVLEWLGDRRPEPPDDLAARVLEAVRGSSVAAAGGGRDAPDGAVTTAPATGVGAEDSESDRERRPTLLTAAARARLAEALAHPGRVRDSAFELLVADALLTYACEAALESERPLEALTRLLEVGRPA